MKPRTDPTDPAFEPPRSSDAEPGVIVLVALGLTAAAALAGIAWLVGGTQGKLHHHADEFLGPS